MIRKKSQIQIYQWQSHLTYPKFIVNGAYGGHGSYDFRLLLYSEEPLQQDELIKLRELDVVREVLAEVILSPLAAKQTAEWLKKYVKKFEEENGPVPGPKNLKKNEGKIFSNFYF